MQNKIKKADPDKKYRRVLAASTLAGDSVRNSAGEDLGKVDEIMIDIPSGRVAYAVLSFGGVLGMGNKLFAVPWSALRVDEDEKSFILDVDKTKLEKAPGFDKSNWPNLGIPLTQQTPTYCARLVIHFASRILEKVPASAPRARAESP